MVICTPIMLTSPLSTSFIWSFVYLSSFEISISKHASTGRTGGCGDIRFGRTSNLMTYASLSSRLVLSFRFIPPSVILLSATECVILFESTCVCNDQTSQLVSSLRLFSFFLGCIVTISFKPTSHLMGSRLVLESSKSLFSLRILYLPCCEA